MMIFLLILKIIGIILLVIVGILTAILFVPVFYEVDANIDEMDYRARIRWLAPLIRFEFRWKEKAHVVLHILWHVIDFTDPEAVAARKAKKEQKAGKKRRRQQQKEARKKRKQKRQTEKETQKADAMRDSRTQQREAFRQQQEQETITRAENVTEEKSVQESVAHLQAEAVKRERTTQLQEKEEPEKEEHESHHSVKEKIRATKEKTASVREKIKTGISVIRYLKEEGLIAAIWEKLKVFLMHIRPRKLTGNLKFGLSNPADTGQVLGLIAMVPLFYQTELQIEPDFEAEENYLRGNVSAKGYLCCIHLVILLIRLLRDEKIRALIHTMREKNEQDEV